MDVCRFSEARYRSQVFTPPCVQSSASPPPSLQVGLTLSSSFAPRPLSKLMALSLASVLNSRVSSRLFPWTNSKPWCLLTIYWLSGKRIATYHKVLPDSKINHGKSVSTCTFEIGKQPLAKPDFNRTGRTVLLAQPTSPVESGDLTV